MTPDRELQEWALRGLTGLQFVVQYKEPYKPKEGLVVYADGTEWAPDVNGPGVFVYQGGTWVRLS